MPARWLLLLLLGGCGLGGLGLGGFASAQQRLVVNGVAVEGYAPGLVPGSAYAPATPLARALGATYSYSFEADTATFELGGTFVSVPVFDTVTAAATPARPLLVNGRPQGASEGGVRTENGVFVPVRPVAGALGGTTAYLAGENTVMVTFPRATLLGVTPPEPGGDARFVFHFSARVPVRETASGAGAAPGTEADTEADTVRFHFGRTDLPASQEESWRGAGFEASLRAAAGGVDFTLTRPPESRVTWFSTPRGAGFTLVLDVVPADRAPSSEADAPTARDAPLIVIDPGHGGEDRGLIFEVGPESGGAAESALTLAFAGRLRDALLERGYPSRLTREADTSPPLGRRAAAGTGADLFVSLHAARLPEGRFNLYFLDDGTLSGDGVSPSPTLDLAPDFTPDFPAGERYARAVSGALAGTLAPQALESAPLAVLGGAAGRGVMLELSPQDLASETLPARLADALVAALQNETAE